MKTASLGSHNHNTRMYFTESLTGDITETKLSENYVSMCKKKYSYLHT